MPFADPDAMSPEKAARNEAAANNLIPGRTYRFEPPVIAGAIPVAGTADRQVPECQFHTGWYLGRRNGKYVFQGKPVNDGRKIPDNQRECYFHVLFTGGSVATPID